MDMHIYVYNIRRRVSVQLRYWIEPVKGGQKAEKILQIWNMRVSMETTFYPQWTNVICQ